VKKPQRKKPHTNNSPSSTDTKVSAVGWIGPLPPPAALQQFDSIIENGAERIFKMAEAEQAARLAREAEAINTKSKNSKPFDKTTSAANGWALSLPFGHHRRIGNRLSRRASFRIDCIGWRSHIGHSESHYQ